MKYNLLSVILTLSLQTLSVSAKVNAIKANDFLNSIGVSTHITQGVDNPTNVATALTYCGFRNIRDDGSKNVAILQKFISVHNKCGAKVSLLSVNGDITASLAEYRMLAKAGALLAAEGPNEPNNWPVTYNGKTSSGTTSMPVAEFQRDLYAAVKADPLLANIPVFHSSESGGSQPDNCGLQFLTIPDGTNCKMPDGTVYADYANTHNYVCGTQATKVLEDNQAWNAENPTLNSHWDGLYVEYGHTWWGAGFDGYTTTQLLTLPRVTTETGWVTRGKDSITEDQQGKLFLNLYLAAYKRGWSYTFVYMLHDDTNQGYWGFVHTDYSHKLSATYLHNMTTILADTTSSFTTDSLDYSFSKKPITVHDMLMQKSDGTFELAVWSEKVSGTNSLTVNLGAVYPSVNVYDPTVGAAPVQTLSNVSAIPLILSDHPVIIEVSPVISSVKDVKRENAALATVYTSSAEALLHVENRQVLKKIELLDLTGKTVLQLSDISAGSTQLDLAHVQKGSYLLRLTDTFSKVENHKIIIN